MSKAHVLTKGNQEWLKNLTPGTPLYSAEYVSEQEEVVLHKLIFEKYDTSSIKKPESDSIYAFLKLEKAPNVNMSAVNIAYGYYQTPLEALETFDDVITEISKAAKIAIRDEKNRLAKAVNESVKKGE